VSNLSSEVSMPTTETKKIYIVINGEVRSVATGANLLDVLSLLDIAPDRVAIEKDRSIVRKTEWGVTLLQPGAQLEIVQFVGGG
jgi:thiamine biosynthesis protein ThiS